MMVWTWLMGVSWANGGPDDWTRETALGDARPVESVRTRLVSERLEVTFEADVDRVHAKATYTLQNDGAPETIRYAVPMLGIEDAEWSTRVPPTPPTLSLAGRPVQCTMEALARPIPLFEDTYDVFDPVAARACVAEITVPSGSSVLTLSLVEEPFHESMSTSKSLHPGSSDRDWVWMLAPAGSWRGTVDSLEVVLDPGPLGDLVQPKTPGFVKKDDKWILRREAVDLASEPPLHVHLAVKDLVRQRIVLGMAKRGFLLKPTSARASSTLASQGGNTYAAANLFDNDPDTAWCEGVDGTGKGSWVELRYAPPDLAGLPIPQRMQVGPLAMAILPGYAKSASSWVGNGRVRALKVTTCDGGAPTTVPLTVADDPRASLVTHRFAGDPSRDLDDGGPMARAVTGPWFEKKQEACIRVELEAVVPGARWQDTCISELHFWPETYGM